MFVFMKPISSPKTWAYSILSLESNASDNDVKKAFKREALKCHPDKCGTADAKARFDDITKARQILLSQPDTEDIDILGTASKIFRDFVGSDDDYLDHEAQELFDFLNNIDHIHGMDVPPPNVSIISDQPTLSLDINVDIMDIWKNMDKKVPVKNTHLLTVPLTTREIIFEGKPPSPWSEISINIADKFHPRFRRRGNYDIETIATVRTAEPQRVGFETHDGLAWTNWEGSQTPALDMGFFVENEGLMDRHKTRGRLWVRLYSKETEATEQEFKKERERKSQRATPEEWWNNKGKREDPQILEMSKYLKKLVR